MAFFEQDELARFQLEAVRRMFRREPFNHVRIAAIPGILEKILPGKSVLGRRAL
jgi:hypothetical protein